MSDDYSFMEGKWLDAQRQLIMSRYAMHKVRTKIYADRVVSGRLTEEQAAEEYAKAMENYDHLMAIANDPGRIEPCVDDMAKGFVMPEPDALMWWQRQGDNSPLENEPEGG